MSVLDLLFGSRMLSPVPQPEGFKERVWERQMQPKPLSPIEQALVVLAGTPPKKEKKEAPKEQSKETKSDIEKNIREGFREYSGGKELPIEEYIPMFVEAAEKYPIFRDNPYLLPQLAILESSGGRNITRANNPLNWAARIQKQGLYSPESWEQSIADAISAISGDRPQGPRYRQTTYYEPFRQSGDIQDFARAWEPRGDEGASYARDLMEGMRAFR